MRFSTENKPLSSFNFSSLTDIVMLLLIFFLLSSQFVMQTGVKVKLPGSKSNEPLTTSNLSVTITNDGTVYIGTEVTALSELPMKFSMIKAADKDNNLIIRADKTVPIEMVIKVIDAARSAGIDKFIIETEKDRLN
ncbi:MAG: biopolymer transporter ExbD [Ignavibacteriales bacterium]|nr:Biopolymer transport protein ExbD [Ignavibacteriaceae bacterium]MCK6612887.1 biopolymer transporter ExbD [Ignavibacteriaceae bacterium]QOJ29398.1 MAG: biopolymer transporter ExbD [Ignavibacteriales bacterium]